MDKDNHQQIRCRVIIELVGKPKEHIENTLKQYVERIKEDANLIIVEENIHEIKEMDNMFSTFAELEMVFRGVPHMIGFCFDYMPASIEVLKPEQIIFKNRDISHFMNDLQVKLHDVDMVAKKLNAENSFLRRNMKAIINNTLSVLLKLKPMDIKEINRFTGIPEEELLTILNKQIKEGKIEKEGQSYRLPKHEPEKQD